MKMVFNVILGILYIMTGVYVSHPTYHGKKLIGEHDDKYGDPVSGTTLILIGITFIWVAIQ